MSDDPVILHLDAMARLLEAAGYAVEVDYSGATIIVWAEVWPTLVKVKRRKSQGESQNATEEKE